MELARGSWTDADALAEATDLAVLPVGSTEQHGPHAPLGTDFMSAAAIAHAGAERHEAETGTPVAVAPTVPVGVAEEHRQFTGTLWVREDSFRAYVGDVVRSLAHQGFSRVVVVNGHGGNTDALFECCARVTRDGDAYAVPYTWFDAVDGSLLDGLGHGGPVETSMMLAVDPSTVHEDRLQEGADSGAETWGEFLHGTPLAFDSAEFTEGGAVGDPTAASVERGEALLADAATTLQEVLATVAERELGRPPHR